MMVEDPRYKWYVTACTMVGTLMVILDTVIVNVGLPKIMASFGVNVDTGQWVVTSYMLTMAIMMPTVGWAGEVLGHRNLYLLSLSIFTFGSIFCALSWNIESLIFFRSIQGIGGGALMPISMVIIFESFPERQRGLAMGIYGLGASMGPAIGPTVGGYLIDKFNWPSMFWINVPTGIAGIIATLVVMKEIRSRRKLKFDFIGFATMSVFLIALLLALSQGKREGWHSNYIVSLFVISLIAVIVFLLLERRTAQPIIDLKLYKSAVYTAATLVSVFLGIIMFSSTFLTPLFLQNILGMDALQTGLMVFPGAIVTAVLLPTSGWLADRIDPRIPMAIGITGFLASAYLGMQLDARSSDAFILAMVMLRGVGIAMIFPPLLNAALMYVSPLKVGMASGLINVMRQIGGTFGVAITSTLLESRAVVHEFTMGEAIDSASYGARNAIKGLSHLLQGSGLVDSAAHPASLAILKRYISGQAIISAFDDSFWVLFVIFSFAIIPTIVIRKKARSANSERPD
jgi:DHA2 family multidrug resistance protein